MREKPEGVEDEDQGVHRAIQSRPKEINSETPAEQTAVGSTELN